jgi:RNA polymerase sigma factor (sigma-70 family)
VLAEDATEERIPPPRRWVQPPPKLLTHLSDERLIARVRAGDDRAFEALYDRHHRPLLAFCRHLLGSADEAEDALQHTFISAHRSLRADERPVALRAWLFTIARNRCLSILRSRRDVVALTAVEPTLPVTVGLATQVEQREDLQALVRDLHALNEEQRAALVLSELGDLDHEEIANVLGVRRARVATLVFQARASLMETRKARDASCSDIQEQLATLRGGALRRSTLRRHVESCSACQAFRAEVRRQRAALALVLPVAPSMGLKRSVLGAISSGGGAAGAVAAAGGVSGGIAVLGGGASGGVAASSAAAVASTAAVAGAPAVAGTAAVAAGGIGAGVAAGGAAVAAAGGAAVAAKAIGVKVLLAAAVASGGPGLQAAAEGLGVEKLQRPPSEALVAPAVPETGTSTGPGNAKGSNGTRSAATGQAAPGTTSSPATGTGAAAGAGVAGGETEVEDTGTGAGAVPDEVIPDEGSSETPAGQTPPAEETPPAETPPPTSETPPPPETTPAGTPPPAETPPAEEQPPPETTPAQEPPPVEEEPAEEEPPAETTADPPPTDTTGSGAPEGEPTATGASVGMPEPPLVEPPPAEPDPDEIVAAVAP